MKSIHSRYQMRMMMSEEEEEIIPAVLNKAEYIRYLAVYLHEQNSQIDVIELRALLNWNDYKNVAGLAFDDPKEIEYLIHSTYNFLIENDYHGDASKIAIVYKRTGGSNIIKKYSRGF